MPTVFCSFSSVLAVRSSVLCCCALVQNVLLCLRSTLRPAASAAISTTAGLSARAVNNKRSVPRGGAAVRPMAVAGEVAQVAWSIEVFSQSAVSLVGVVGGLAAVSKLSGMRIESRVEEYTKKAEGYGIDLTDLYYDFDVPGDQYPFGDGEDWMPASWKPPKNGDSKYLPTKMLGQIQIRTNQYEVIQKCEAKGIEIGDLCVPFEVGGCVQV
jgi:hypothetical protein